MSSAAAIHHGQGAPAPVPLVNAEALLTAARDAGASDLHLAVGAPPTLRVDGAIRAIPGHASLRPDAVERLAWSILTDDQRSRLEREGSVDVDWQPTEAARARVHVCRERSQLAVAVRPIADRIPTLEELRLPQVVGQLAGYPRGLVLVTGTTGSGKSTTQAAVLDRINQSRQGRIVTVEDPIEYLHHHKRCMVIQRQVGIDVDDFPTALRDALREDPDVVLVGEMRDLETIETAVAAAETGHLVFATVHAPDAVQCVDRIIDVFPAGQQQHVRVQLAATLQAIVAQQLLPATAGGRQVVCEVLLATPAVRNQIRERETHQLANTLQTGGKLGMRPMDASLAELVRSGRIEDEVARAAARDRGEYQRHLDGAWAR